MLKSKTKTIAALAVMAALLEMGKFSLNAVANVEIVTLLCALFGYVFGFWSLASVVVFVLLEICFWGVAPWVLSYLLHFGTITAAFALMKKLNVKNVFLLSFVAIILTALFGVTTGFIDLCFSGLNNFFERFGVYYSRGIVFYAIHILSNAAIFLILFAPLKALLEKIKSSLNL